MVLLIKHIQHTVSVIRIQLQNDLLQYHIINETGVKNMFIHNRPVQHTGSRQYDIISSKDTGKIKGRRSLYKTLPRNTVRLNMFEKIFLRREVKITPVMTQAYIIGLFQILPSPVQTGQLTISLVLTARKRIGERICFECSAFIIFLCQGISA